jgi:hypothetical protein
MSTNPSQGQPPRQSPASPPRTPRSRAIAKPVITINPYFKLLICINCALCVITLIGMILLAFFAPEPMTKAQEQLAGACEAVFKMTAGAFIGLLGGRAAAPDRLQQSGPQDEVR